MDCSMYSPGGASEYTPDLLLPWTHPSPQHKRYLDRFRQFAQLTAQCRPACQDICFPLKIVPWHSAIWTPIEYMVPWAYPSPQSKRHLDRFSRFCTAHYCDRQADIPTDHATRSVTIGRINVHRTAMQLNNSRH